MNQVQGFCFLTYLDIFDNDYKFLSYLRPLRFGRFLWIAHSLWKIARSDTSTTTSCHQMAHSSIGCFCHFLSSRIVLYSNNTQNIITTNLNRICKTHDKISCLCSFLFASMKLNLSANKIKAINDKPENQNIFNLADLKEAIQVAAYKSYLQTLLNAVRIFIPVHILDPRFFYWLISTLTILHYIVV